MNKFDIFISSLYEWKESSLYIEVVGIDGKIYANCDCKTQMQIINTKAFMRNLLLPLDKLLLFAGTSIATKEFILYIEKNSPITMTGKDLYKTPPIITPVVREPAFPPYFSTPFPFSRHHSHVSDFDNSLYHSTEVILQDIQHLKTTHKFSKACFLIESFDSNGKVIEKAESIIAKKSKLPFLRLHLDNHFNNSEKMTLKILLDGTNYLQNYDILRGSKTNISIKALILQSQKTTDLVLRWLLIVLFVILLILFLCIVKRNKNEDPITTQSQIKISI